MAISDTLFEQVVTGYVSIHFCLRLAIGCQALFTYPIASSAAFVFYDDYQRPNQALDNRTSVEEVANV